MQVFSPNMLKTYFQCPKMYYFRYVKNISMPSDEDIFQVGKNIHAIASYYLKGENIDKLEKGLTQKEAELWNYLKNIKYFKFNIIDTEYNLSVRLKNGFASGRLDALLQDDDTYYILDYKTGTVPKNPVYDFQTMIYIISVNELYNTDNIIFVYIDLKNKKETEIKFSEILKEEYILKLNDITEKILKSDFSAKNNNCKYCEYRKICNDKILD